MDKINYSKFAKELALQDFKTNPNLKRTLAALDNLSYAMGLNDDKTIRKDFIDTYYEYFQLFIYIKNKKYEDDILKLYLEEKLNECMKIFELACINEY